MKVLSFVFLVGLNSACTSTHPVDVEYRSRADFTGPKQAPLQIIFKGKQGPEDKLLVSALERKLISDGWWQLAAPGNRGVSNYALELSEATQEAEIDESSTRIKEQDGDRVREAHFNAHGKVNYTFKKDGVPKFALQATTTAQVQSDRPLPQVNLKSGIIPMIERIAGLSGKSDIKEQNAQLKSIALEKCREDLASQIVAKITPVKTTILVPMEVQEKDMELLKKFVDKKELDNAYNYLLELKKRKSRSDIVYNLAVIQEARQNNQEACELYGQAYDMKDKDLYLEQKISCEGRLNAH